MKSGSEGNHDFKEILVQREECFRMKSGSEGKVGFIQREGIFNLFDFTFIQITSFWFYNFGFTSFGFSNFCFTNFLILQFLFWPVFVSPIFVLISFWFSNFVLYVFLRILLILLMDNHIMKLRLKVFLLNKDYINLKL